MATSAKILLGTTKGAFVLDPNGKDWSVSGPHCDGWGINHAIGDPDTGMLWAGGGGDWHGAGVWRSEDGAKWELSKLSNGQIDEEMLYYIMTRGMSEVEAKRIVIESHIRPIIDLIPMEDIKDIIIEAVDRELIGE